MTRIVDNYRLYFLFNEGFDAIEEALDTDPKKYIYEIDVSNGSIYKRDRVKAHLLCGDIKVFIITDDELPAASEESEYSLGISDFEVLGYERFSVDKAGVRKDYFEGSPIIDDAFSGTVYYSAKYELPKEPMEKERYRLSLQDTSVTAAVYIDGCKACDLGLLPMRAEIDGSMLRKHGRIEVRVSNTAANELLAKRDFIRESFPEEEIGIYSLLPGKQAYFEERRAPLQLGRLIIEKLG